MSIFKILAQIVSGPFGFVCLLALSKWVYSRRTTFKVAAAFIVINAIVNAFIIIHFTPVAEQFPIVDFIYRVGNMSLVFLVACILVQWQTTQIVFTAVTVGVIIFIIDTVAITIRVLLGLYPMELLFEFLIYPLVLLLILKIRRPFLEITVYMKNRLWPLSGISLFLLVCLFIHISIPRPLERTPENIPVALMICVISTAVYATEFFLFKTIQVQSELEHNFKVMELNTVSLEHQKNIAIRNAKKTSVIRRDLLHTGQMILACLDTRDIDGARRLIHEIDTNIRVAESMNVIREVTGHKLLDLALSYYTDFATESGVDISVCMSRMDDFDTDMAEFAVVLSNALENAVNACLKLPEGIPRVIRVNGQKHGGQFFLEIANTYIGEIAFNPETGEPVSDRKGHGYGTQSISYFAWKHGAKLEYSIKDNWFHLRLLL